MRIVVAGAASIVCSISTQTVDFNTETGGFRIPERLVIFQNDCVTIEAVKRHQADSLVEFHSCVRLRAQTPHQRRVAVSWRSDGWSLNPWKPRKVGILQGTLSNDMKTGVGYGNSDSPH